MKACGCLLLSVILILILGKSSKDYSMVLTVAVCCMIAMAAMEYIRPVLDFISRIEDLGGLDHDMIQILLKVTGIGLISEVCSFVCTDSGSASLGKVMKILGSSVMIWLSLPLYAMLIELLERILGAI